jgi:hypothetical protein
MPKNNDLKIHIDIVIPFYTYYGCIHRTNLTKKIFKHCINIKNKFCNIVYISFTLIGSEQNISKDLALQFFEKTDYFEFDQKPYTTTLLMLTEKFKFCYERSIEKRPNITLLMGSNDYVCYNFFEQIIKFYNPTELQLYGIDKYNNGNNSVLLTKYNGINNTMDNDSSLWWDGIQSNNNREKYQYVGGIIGFNDLFYTTHYKLLMDQIISFDEGEIEQKILTIPNIVKFKSNECFIFNIKTINLNEITSFDELHSIFKNNIILFTLFNDNMKSQICKEYDIFNLL